MHQLVPHFILQNYADGLTGGSLSAASLFVDTSGFSAMTDALMDHGQHGAEVLAGVMSATFEPLMYSVFEQGGFVTSQEGDAFTALFPVSTTLAEGARRALAAARRIQDIIQQKKAFVTVYGSFSITVKVGLSIGEAGWGIITSAGRSPGHFHTSRKPYPKDPGYRAAYFFRGPAIDGCVQAEHMAQAGNIIMDPHFFNLVQDQTQVEPCGQFYKLVAFEGESPAPQPVAEPSTDIDLAGHFFPRQLLREQHRGEFRQVTYLFVSLPTVRDEEQLRIFLQTVFDLQDLYGGLLRVFFGDKGAHLLIFWGAPVSFENDVERTLNFILDLQSRTVIPIIGGVTYRIAHTGFIGSRLAEDFSAFGRGANLAARFMTEAPRGEIWVDEQVYQKAARVFNLECIGEKNFKGFHLPQKVYVLLDRKEDSDIIFEGALCGRKDELKTIGQFIQPLFRREFCGLMVIYGEPGMGKSRLVHEFTRSLVQDPADSPQVFHCQTDEIVRRPFNPLRYWLRHYFHVSETQGEARNKRNFNRCLDELISSTGSRSLGEELERTRSFLGALLDLHWPDSLYEQVEAKMRYENTLLALGALLQAESLRRPVLLVIEDIHLLDEDTRTAFPRLMRMLNPKQGSPYPVAILATARPDGPRLCLDEFTCQELFINTLQRSEIISMACSLLDPNSPPGHTAISDRLANLLQNRAEGNPFFAGQILLYLRKENLIAIRNGIWDVQADQSVTLPSEIGVLLVSRLDRLVDEVKNVVQTASILGREFEIRLLASMLNDKDSPQVPPEIALAEREAIWSRVNEIRYIFKHALMREAAYQMQLHTRRQELHARALRAYELFYQQNQRDHSSEMAYHADQAGLLDQALKYLELAGKTAQESYQNGLAAAYYTRALELVAKQPLDAQFHEELMFRLLLAREGVFTLLGKVDERREDLSALDKLAQYAKNQDWLCEVWLRQSSFALDTGDYQAAFDLACRTAAHEQSDNPGLRDVQAHHYMGLSLLRQGNMTRAAEEVSRSLAISRQIGNQKEESGILNTMGMIALGQEKYHLAAQYFTLGLETARITSSLRDQALPLNNLGMISGWQGSFTTAREYYQQALELARKVGDKAGEGLVLNNLGYISGNLGDYRQARLFAEQTVQIAREVGDLYNETYSLINLSSYNAALSEFDIAVETAASAKTLAILTGDRSAEAWAHTYLGHALLAMHRYENSAEAYQAALNIRVELAQPVLAAEPGAGLARIAMEQNRLDEAQTLIQPVLAAIDTDDSLAGTDDPLRVYLTCLLILRQANDPRAQSFLQYTYDRLQSRAALISNETDRQFFIHNISHHHEIMLAWKLAHPGL